jgi:hypothetical protein
LTTRNTDPEQFVTQRPRLLQPAGAISLKVAVADRERAIAYRLIQEAYATAGYVEGTAYAIPEPYHSPHSRTFLLMREDSACGTFTIIPDGRLGLVMESVYDEEIAAFRVPPRYLGEVSGLVVDKSLPTGERGTALLYLYQTAYLFSRVTGITDLLIAVNPHHASFYERSLLFESFADFKTYGSLQKAPAVAKRLHMPTWPQRLHSKYGRPEEERTQRYPMDTMLRVLVEALQDGHIPPGLRPELLPPLLAPRSWPQTPFTYTVPAYGAFTATWSTV